MAAWKALVRGAGLTLCVLVFAATALADPGNGNGNGNGNGGTPPGQERKAEAPGQEKKAEAPVTAAPAPAAVSEPAVASKAEPDQKEAEKRAANAAPTEEKPAKENEEKAVEKAERKPGATATAFNGRSAEARHHVIVCHRTGSNSNPYVVINIPLTAWNEAHRPDTGAHPDLNGRHDILLKDPASRPGSKDGFTKADCASRSVATAPPAPSVQTQRPPAGPAATTASHQPQPLIAVAAGTGPAVSTVEVVPKPTTAVRPRPTVKVTGAKVTAPPKKEQRSADVLGSVASPRAVTRTATTDTLPFTGIPLWIVALLGGGLLLTGIMFRRHS